MRTLSKSIRLAVFAALIAGVNTHSMAEETTLLDYQTGELITVDKADVDKYKYVAEYEFDEEGFTAEIDVRYAEVRTQTDGTVIIAPPGCFTTEVYYGFHCPGIYKEVANPQKYAGLTYNILEEKFIDYGPCVITPTTNRYHWFYSNRVVPFNGLAPSELCDMEPMNRTKTKLIFYCMLMRYNYDARSVKLATHLKIRCDFSTEENERAQLYDRTPLLITSGKEWVFLQEYRVMNENLEWEYKTRLCTYKNFSSVEVDNHRVAKIVRAQTADGTKDYKVYEEQGITYYLGPVNNSDYFHNYYPTVDFYARKGDTYGYYSVNTTSFEATKLETATVVAEDSVITLDGVGRRALTFSNGAKWIESVGAVEGENPYLCRFERNATDRVGTVKIDRETMMECSVDGAAIWRHPDYSSLRELAAGGSEETPTTIYDLHGRRLRAPGRGINIINGHKTFVK